MDKIIQVSIVLLAVGGLAWSLTSFLTKQQTTSSIENNSSNYRQALSAELSDKCQTPGGYTDQAWQEHMSHHPDRYKECLTVEESDNLSYRDITVSDLASMLKNKNFMLIDTHIPEQDHIPGTDSFIPYDQLLAQQAELPKDKNSNIVVYCRSGNMSQTAAQQLTQLGYKNVYNLIGGTKAWVAAGGQVEMIEL